MPPPEHALIVPVTGVLEVLHSDDPLDPEATLRTRCDNCGPFTTVRFALAFGGEARAGFFPVQPQTNHRARETLRILTGAHMVLTGPVIFTGVPHHTLGEAVATLSVNE